MIKPITTIAVLAFAFSAFAQAQTLKVKSRGEDVRTVIDSIFVQSGKQYVLETNYHQTLYMNLDGVTFQKAIDILAKITDFEFEEKDGIWFIHKRPAQMAKSVVAPKAPETFKPTPKTNAPAKTSPATPIVASKPATKIITSAQPFATLVKTTAKPAPKVNLTGKLTVQLRKMDIREVFSEFGRQAKVDIELDESVPNYKLDAFFYNTTLKFALEKVCKIAGLKYTFTPSNTVRITKI